MSKGGERVQGMAGSPMPIGYGRSVVRVVADFATPTAESHVKQRNYAISGITKDPTVDPPIPLGGCTVDIFESDSTRRFVASTVSDPTTGAYVIHVNGPDTGMTFKVIASKAGAPAVAGATVSTLTGVEL